MNYKNNIRREDLVYFLSQNKKLSHDYFEKECIDSGISLSLTKASVLVPFLDLNGEINILLTNRSAHLEDHAGQVSFPGGRIDSTDISPVDTATRQSYEEVGIESKNINILGCLDAYQTGTGFRILPVVAFVKEKFTVNINKTEVDELFEVPLEFILDSKNHVLKSGFWNGAVRHYYTINYSDYNIWGATAGMLVNLFERIKANA